MIKGRGRRRRHLGVHVRGRRRGPPGRRLGGRLEELPWRLRREHRLRLDRGRLRRRRRRSVGGAQRIDLVPDGRRRRFSVRRGPALGHQRPLRRRAVFPCDRLSLRKGDGDVFRCPTLRRRGGRIGAPRRRPARRRPPLEERLQLADRPERPWRRARATEQIAPRYLVGKDRPLELAQGEKSELLAATRPDEPAVARSIATGGLLAANLELVTARRAANRRSTPADERVVELVLGFAPLALNVHRLVACGASRAGKLSFPCLARREARRARSRAYSLKADINTHVRSVSIRVLHGGVPPASPGRDKALQTPDPRPLAPRPLACGLLPPPLFFPSPRPRAGARRGAARRGEARRGAARGGRGRS